MHESAHSHPAPSHGGAVLQYSVLSSTHSNADWAGGSSLLVAAEHVNFSDCACGSFGA